MGKTFVEIVEKKMGTAFNEFKSAPELVAFVTNGTPVALASDLRNRMITDPRPEVFINISDLMQFSLKASKRGDSMALTPDFALLDKGKEIITADEFDFEDEDMESLALAIMEDEGLLTALREAMAGKTFNDEEWISSSNKKEKGLTFDEESDVAFSAATVFLSILKVLSNNKDASNEVTYEVPGFGTFNIKYKDEWNVSLSFDKEYKNNCKSDATVAAISALDI